MFAIISTALLATALSGPTLVQDGASLPAKESAREVATEKKVCRRVQPTGTIMPPKSVCRSRTEWKQIDAANRDAADRAQQERHRSIANSPGG